MILSCWGFFFSLESFVFLILLAELLIILLFIILYLTIQFFTLRNSKNNKYKYLFILIFAGFLLTGVVNNFNLINHYVYYNNLGKLTSDDFFIFFYYFFYYYSLIVYLVGIILTLFSIFFIIFYFSCKLYLVSIHQFKKRIYILRKQNLNHQLQSKTFYKTFQ